MKKSSYLNNGRIRDVISLINFLATKSNNSSHQIEIKKSLSRNPMSVDDWEKLSKLHPEFFKTKKTNFESYFIISLYIQKNDALSIDERIRLLEIANSLHDSELNKRNYWTPIIAAIIPALVAVIISLYTLFYNKNKQEDILRKIIHSENKEILTKFTSANSNIKKHVDILEKKIITTNKINNSDDR